MFRLSTIKADIFEHMIIQMRQASSRSDAVRPDRYDIRSPNENNGKRRDVLSVLKCGSHILD